jgi:hypothetical protein
MAIKKEWTVMFYFASDNPLASSIVSQLKALKQAGFHSQVNVIARFDPDIENTPAHIFDVNSVYKLRDETVRAEKLRARKLQPDNRQADAGCDGKGYCYGFGFDDRDADSNGAVSFPDAPFVRNLLEDKLWGRDRQEIIRDSLRREFEGSNVKFKPPVPSRGMSGEQSPKVALRAFLDFCRREYPAKHYMLFILGHGQVVGNDVFLFDEHAAEHSLSLAQLGEILTDFKEGLDKGDEFQLVSFHSCSMSGLEVAYELEGTANYMLASQSPAFVGSWTYLQILIRLFKDVEWWLNGEGEADGGAPDGERPTAEAVRRMLKKFWAYCFYNSYDFRLAGYSFDVSLCNLTRLHEAGDAISDAIGGLADALIDALPDPLAQERILLAHWDAQSFFDENYTDLYDFCLCLTNRCRSVIPASRDTQKKLDAMVDACNAVTRELSLGDDKLVVRSDFIGPTYQYSHGVSVFFPWSAPTNANFWPGEKDDKKQFGYAAYKFSQATKWNDFLIAYFEQTRRAPRGPEIRTVRPPHDPKRHAGNGAKKLARPDGRRLTGFELRDRLNRDLLDGIVPVPSNGNGQAVGGPAGVTLGKAGGIDPLGKAGGIDPLGPGKAGGIDPTGEDDGSVSIKNYPSVTRAPAGSKAASKKPAPARVSAGRGGGKGRR